MTIVYISISIMAFILFIVSYYHEDYGMQIVTGITFLMMFAILIPIYLSSEYKYKYEYEYIDLDNNKGIAKECYSTDYSGTPVCELEDGTIIIVKQYKPIVGDKE